jgi:hypothetical protein
MPDDPVNPEDCLRSLAAKALLWAHPDRPLFPDSLRLMAVANAFVMLGLLPEPRAEAVLAEHKSALERIGLGDVWGVTEGELTVRPGADGYWQSRMAGPGGLREVPLLVAVAGVSCPTSVAEVCFEWVKLTSMGWRLTFRATAPDPDPYRNWPAPDAMDRAMSEISLTDDAGQSHDLRAEDVGWSRDLSLGEQEWHGHVVVARDPASRPAWFELAPTIGGAPGRVTLPSPARVPVGRSDPPWPTPAEGYLAALAPVTTISIEAGGTVAEAGPEETARIVATVADSLIAVGALPVTSTLLREFPGSGPGWRVPGWEVPGWHVQLTHQWGRRAHQQAARFRAAEHRRLVVQLPLEHATAVIEGVSAQDDLVIIQLYGHPWVMGEYPPMIAPCFQVRAVDDAGDEHEGRPGDWRGFPGGEGSGNFWFWPPVPSARKSIRVIVSTLWEAAWADIELPR